MNNADFENYMTAHIAKIVTQKHLDEQAMTIMGLTQSIVQNILCEVYPLALSYSTQLFNEN